MRDHCRRSFPGKYCKHHHTLPVSLLQRKLQQILLNVLHSSSSSLQFPTNPKKYSKNWQKKTLHIRRIAQNKFIWFTMHANSNTKKNWENHTSMKSWRLFRSNNLLIWRRSSSKSELFRGNKLINNLYYILLLILIW